MLDVDALRAPGSRTSVSATPACERMPTPTIETLAIVVVGRDPLGRADARAQLRPMISTRALEVAARHREGQVGAPRRPRRSGRSCRRRCSPRDSGLKILRRDARAVGHARRSVIFASSLRRGDAGRPALFPWLLLLGHDPGPCVLVEARAHVDRHAVLHAELDRADLQHLGAERRQLEHLLVADAVDLARVGARCSGRWCRRRRRRCRSRRRRP